MNAFSRLNDTAPHSRPRSTRMARRLALAAGWRWLALLGGLAGAAAAIAADTTTAPHEIQAVDAATGRGVPLVELETVHNVRLVTDNAGRIAFHEPGLMDREVFFHVRSHGYEVPKDGFGYRGARLTPTAGGRSEVRLQRLNLAERLHRVTGQGLFRDSLLLGRAVPLARPLLNGGVLGQDSVQGVVHRGRIRWFWGDTNRAGYPLGLFRTSGATSKLPSAGGLPVVDGIDLDYAVGADGFSRAMIDLPEKEGVIWIDGVSVVPDDAGREVLVCHYSRREGLVQELAQGIAVFDEAAEVFRSAVGREPGAWQIPRGHPTRWRDADGTDWLLIGDPFLHTRVRATLAAVLDPSAYEAWDGGQWQKTSAPPKADPLTDADTGQPVTIHAGSCRWNAHRQRWIMIANQIGGKPSYLGEVWYAEAASPTGPWVKARRIVTHDRMDFYNPVHHDFLDEAGGRIIHFEGTYTNTFSGNPDATPRYNYNQVMYRLDLDDPRLAGARAEPAGG
jgi:hypothetical protein